MIHLILGIKLPKMGLHAIKINQFISRLIATEFDCCIIIFLLKTKIIRSKLSVCPNIL